MGCGAISKMDAEPSAGDLASLTFSKAYRGQLAPPPPSASELSEGKTATGELAVALEGKAAIQRGPFGSIWLRAVGQVGMPAMLRLAESIERTLALDAKYRGAVYICVWERMASELGVLRDGGYNFYHMRDDAHRPEALRQMKPAGAEPEPGGAPPLELVYYKWVGKSPNVPPYTTSIEGVTGLCFSPADGADIDAAGDHVLMTFEHGAWRTPGGAVERGELKLDSLARELSEEVGIVLDSTFTPAYLGGWQASRSRDGVVNDNFSAFAVRASSAAFTVDGVEIVDGEARWFAWRPLLELWRRGGSKSSGKSEIDEAAAALLEEGPLGAPLPAGRRKVANNVLSYLGNYTSGRGLAVVPESEGGVTTLKIGGPAPAPGQSLHSA